MKRADLYLLSTPALSEQVRFACRLCEKAILEFKRIHIQTENSLQNEALDTELWTFKTESFLPHQVGQNDINTPILIDTNDLNQDHFLASNLLVLMSASFPSNATNFDRVCILVPNEAEHIQQARKLYKAFKNAGFEVHSHDMR